MMPRFCLDPRCGVIVTRGYCREHARRNEQQRGSSNARGYTWQWSKRAKLFLSDYPLCGMRPMPLAPVMSQCQADGIKTPADVVDHVIPHRGDPGLFDAVSNWQSLCFSCHARKSQTERGE